MNAENLRTRLLKRSFSYNTFDPTSDRRFAVKYNPYRHLEEIVAEDIRAMPTFPYNEDRTQRWCYRCQEFQDIADFRPHYGSCKKSIAPSIEQKRNANYRKNYGISLEEYNAMFQSQGGRCAACHRKETKKDPRTKTLRNLSVDHDHETGEIRGLLCAECNTALGLLCESQSRARGLINYMKRFQTPNIKPMQLGLWEVCE